jgi:RNA polymerase sigma-70 factor (ECF subfamily)
MNPTFGTPEHEGGPHGSSATSRSLLARVQADEPDAWERCVHLYAPLVFHWCRCRGVQREDAADLFQEVFRAVVVNVRRFRKEHPDDTFRGWLRRITENKIHDHFRRRNGEIHGIGGSSARERLAELPWPPHIDLAPDDDAERALVGRALALIRGEFEERTWTAFWRTTVDGMAAKDVATELAMSPGAVRVAKSRVLHRLREELGDATD